MTRIFLSGQAAADFIQALAGEADANTTELELEHALDENAALREALATFTKDSRAAMRGAVAEIERLEDQNRDLRDQVKTVRQYGDTTRHRADELEQEVKYLRSELIVASAQRDAALHQVESMKQHLTDSGVEGLKERIDLLEKANDALSSSRHYLNVQLEEALQRQMDFRQAEVAYAYDRLSELRNAAR